MTTHFWAGKQLTKISQGYQPSLVADPCRSLRGFTRYLDAMLDAPDTPLQPQLDLEALSPLDWLQDLHLTCSGWLQEYEASPELKEAAHASSVAAIAQELCQFLEVHRCSQLPPLDIRMDWRVLLHEVLAVVGSAEPGRKDRQMDEREDKSSAGLQFDEDGGW